MQNESPRDPTVDPEVLLARQEVELAREELEVRLRDVGRAGRRVWKGLGRQARPVLIGAAIVVGAVILVRVARSVARAGRRGEWLPPRRASLLGLAVRSALDVAVRTLVTGLARRAAERLLSREPARLSEGQPLEPTDLPAR